MSDELVIKITCYGDIPFYEQKTNQWSDKLTYISAPHSYLFDVFSKLQNYKSCNLKLAVYGERRFFKP